MSARGPELKNGPIRYSAGIEARTEILDDDRSALSEAGQIVGGLEGRSFNASREVYAVFAEVAVPVAPKVEIRGAGRTEYYSDFGDTTKPKVSIAYKPFKRLTLRASYGGAFLAPSLAHLYTPRLSTFSSGLIADPNPDSTAFGTQSQVQTNTGGNRALEPEETQVYSVGFQWEQRPDRLGFAVEGSWFFFDQKNLLNALSAEFLINNEAIFPGRVVRSPAPAGSPVGAVGPIQYVDTFFENLDTRTYQGFDLDVSYAFETGGLGRWQVSASTTVMESLKLLNNEFAGEYGNPELRGNAGINWSLRDWGASLFANYIGSYAQRSAAQQAATGDIEQDVRLNATVSYADVFGWKATLGVRNILNAEPPFDASRAEGYNLNVSSGETRYVTLTMSRKL
jgi:iron complex outermembrane receptor protein